MRRRDLLTLIAAGAIGRPVTAAAQRPAGVPLVGILMGATPSVEAARLKAFLAGLEELGYRDGQTVAIEVRYAEGQRDRFAPLAHELVAAAPSVIACVGRLETAALQAETRTIPIVFMIASNAVELGLVTSLAHPGGNTTGFTPMAAELDSKRLELLHEIAPSLTRAAFLINPSFLPGVEERFVDAKAAAKSLGIALLRVAATMPAEVSAALAAIQASSSEAVLVQNDPLLSGIERAQMLEFAASHHLLTVFETKGSTVARSGLLSYGIDENENARLAAGYVAKILKGAKPADLPVQRPTKFEFVINLRVAKELGLTVPPSLLARADEIIE